MNVFVFIVSRNSISSNFVRYTKIWYKRQNVYYSLCPTRKLKLPTPTQELIKRFIRELVFNIYIYIFIYVWDIVVFMSVYV